jgi:hypothetical protein
MGFFRGLMVPICFVLYLALFAAVAVAVIALGPLSAGTPPADLPKLIPSGAGAPSPYAIAAALAAVADLFLAMVAMFIAERVFTAWRFATVSVKASLWFAIPFAGGFAAWLSTQPGDGLAKWLPAVLLLLALPVAAFVVGLFLGKPFVWWVSERPPVKRPKRRPPPPPPAEPPAEIQDSPTFPPPSPI